MKIRSIELFQVPPRWLFLKMTTESGICGWGEPVVEGRAATVAACVKEMTPMLSAKARAISKTLSRCSTARVFTAAAQS